MAEVEETLNRIRTHKGVQGVLVLDSKGTPLRSSLDAASTAKYGAAFARLCQQAKSVVRDLDPQNDLTFLRVRSKKFEVLAAPDKEFLLLVLQDPCAESPSLLAG